MEIRVQTPGGYGIGPEVVDSALRVREVAARSIGLKLDIGEDLLHGVGETGSTRDERCL